MTFINTGGHGTAAAIGIDNRGSVMRCGTMFDATGIVILLLCPGAVLLLDPGVALLLSLEGALLLRPEAGLLLSLEEALFLHQEAV